VTVHYQIPRNSLLWMLAAQVAVIAPHLQHLPLWVLLAWAITVLWRVQIYRGVWSYPGIIVKTVLIVVCMGGLISQYGRFFGLEPMLGLLVTAFVLKLLEMQKKRDALIVIYLGYFVAATVFLLFTTVVTTLYVFFTLILLTTALIGLNQNQGVFYPWRSAGLATKLLLQSIPMMMVLFLVIPRIGSLWAVPQPQQGARTGVSSTMSPGDFSHLAQDDTVAFRVTFYGEVPPPGKRYWRGLTLSSFDGRQWEFSDFSRYQGDDDDGRRRQAVEDWRERVEPLGEALEYDIIMEPHYQYWYYVLPMPDPTRQTMTFTRDFSLVSRRPVNKRYQYSQRSYLDYRWDLAGLDERTLNRELRLPPNSNPRSVAQAAQWRSEADSDRAYIDRVLSFFNQQFTYTLEPPLLGEHSADEFLWQTQRGFCEHFASAFVIMMRAAGIPARVVVGYQGGEFNPVKNFLAVRNSDAHAWSEVWLDGDGWIRVDPTGAVAPERIEYGLRQALSADEAEQITSAFTLSGYSRVPLLNRLRYRLEAMEYNWHRLVLGYDQDRQSTLLRNLLGEVTPLRFALLLLGSGVLLFGLVGLFLFVSGLKRVSDPGERAFRQFLRRLKAKGFEPEVGEGPRSLADRVSETSPNLGAWAQLVVKNYERYAYEGNPNALPALRKAVLLRL
jgi:transglutaminase-like putative cysteine protease